MDKGECTSTPSAHAQILVSSSLQHFRVRDYVYFIILIFLTLLSVFSPPCIYRVKNWCRFWQYI